MDLNVWDKCNNRCLMCTNPDSPWPAWDGSFDYSYDAIIRRLEKMKEKIKLDDSIYLTGGEPTLHPQFLNILKYLTQNFPKQKITLLTNGRRFLYKDFTKKVLEINDDFDIDVSLHGPTAYIYDKITRVSDSFKQTIKGLENLLFYKNKQTIGIRFVITKLSYKYIAQFLEMVKRHFPSIDKIIFLFWEPEGQAIKNLETVKITYNQVRPYLEKIQPLIKPLKEIRFYHFPLCTIPKRLWPYTWRTLRAEEVDFIKKCDKCYCKNYCLGIHKNYLKYMASEDFRPISKKIKLKLGPNFHHPINRVVDGHPK
jgi:MoaA/NifB/PqqE/SkfB family radical SAM enzyme